ncbi:hypothetical protein ACFODL_06010 [Phenylobacterium terrae]|uniref:Uncharacterized protein n=1 Tax=Phenylobacterium terrae TaxID=2665495 RepID=A0ABW4N5S5_9CAUL
MLGARMAAPHVARVTPLYFPERLKYARVGDNWSSAGAKAAKRYTETTGNRTRVIYYNPKDFM